jgi:maltodextrin utilization protein YvdJ
MSDVYTYGPVKYSNMRNYIVMLFVLMVKFTTHVSTLMLQFVASFLYIHGGKRQTNLNSPILN